MRIFLDANVLFTAAHHPEGKAALVVELGNAGHYQLFTSDYACEEARRNLSAKYPKCLARFEQLASILDRALACANAALPEGLAAKDAAIFQAAAACRASHLLTGDFRHFGPFMNQPARTGSILIQTVTEFLDSLRSRSRARRHSR